MFTLAAFNAQATTIHTDRNYGYGIFSPIYTYGQTFQLQSGDDTVLDSIKLYAQRATTSTVEPEFSVSLYEWNGSAPTGSSLFTSGINTVTYPYAYQPFTINTGGIQLSTGTDYIWHLTLADISGKGNIGADTTGSYAHGSAYYYRYGNWYNTNMADLAFTLELSPGSAVPEPCTMLLLGVGLVGLAGLGRKNRTCRIQEEV